MVSVIDSVVDRINELVGQLVNDEMAAQDAPTFVMN